MRLTPGRIAGNSAFTEDTTMTDKHFKPVCDHCGSDDITRDAVARWDVDTGEWVMTDTYDDEFCGACEDTTTTTMEIKK